MNPTTDAGLNSDQRAGSSSLILYVDIDQLYYKIVHAVIVYVNKEKKMWQILAVIIARRLYGSAASASTRSLPPPPPLVLSNLDPSHRFYLSRDVPSAYHIT